MTTLFLCIAWSVRVCVCWRDHHLNIFFAVEPCRSIIGKSALYSAFLLCNTKLKTQQQIALRKHWIQFLPAR